MVDQRHIDTIKAAKERLSCFPFPWDDRWIAITREQYIALGGAPETWDNMKYEGEEDGNPIP